MTRSHSKTESRPGSILTAPKGKLRYKQFLLSVISLTLACSKRTENSGSSKAWINGHPSGDIKCAICHARSIPVATIAVGIVAATANTSGTKFYHSSKNIGSNDCSVCHPWNYAGQVNGWAHGNFGNRHSGINSNCLECHETPTGQITDSERQTPSGRSFTIHFHNLIPTGFSEDPGRAHDCSVCHTHDAGFKSGHFGPSEGPHLTDVTGIRVSRCLDCHDYPANYPSPPFPPQQHSIPQAQGYDCSHCHLKPDQLGGTQPGGFGDL